MFRTQNCVLRAVVALALWLGVGVAPAAAQGDASADLDGDGVVDELVVRPGEGAALGEVTVRSGATGAALFTIEGVAAGELFGLGAVIAGDLNGDGVADVLVPAPLADGHLRTGRVDGFSGVDGAWLFTVWPSQGESFTSVVGSASDLFAANTPAVAVQAVEFVGGTEFTSWLVIEPFTDRRIAKGPGATEVWHQVAEPPLVEAVLVSESDVDGDGAVTMADFEQVLNCFADPACMEGDLDGDGAVDTSDLLLVVSQLGETPSTSSVASLPVPIALSSPSDDPGGTGGGAMATPVTAGSAPTFLAAVGTETVAFGGSADELTITGGALVDLGYGVGLVTGFELVFDDQGNVIGGIEGYAGYDSYLGFAPGPIGPPARLIEYVDALNIPEYAAETVGPSSFSTGTTAVKFLLGPPTSAVQAYGIENVNALQPITNPVFTNRLALFFGQLSLDAPEATVDGDLRLDINVDAEDRGVTLVRPLGTFDDGNVDHQAVVVYSDLPDTGTPGEPRRLAALYWISANPPLLPEPELVGDGSGVPLPVGLNILNAPSFGETLNVVWGSGSQCIFAPVPADVTWEFTLPGSTQVRTATWPPAEVTVDPATQIISLALTPDRIGLTPAEAAALAGGDQLTGLLTVSLHTSTDCPGPLGPSADIDRDGEVGATDFIAMLVAFGSDCIVPAGPNAGQCDCNDAQTAGSAFCRDGIAAPCHPAADLVGDDCRVDADDFIAMLVAYGTTCPPCDRQTTEPLTITLDSLDSDCDGTSDHIEQLSGTNYLPPVDTQLDTDGDGFSDRFEAQLGVIVRQPLACDPALPDATTEALLMAAHRRGEFVSVDGDYLPDIAEVFEGLSIDPGVTDTDGDGLSDLDEIFEHRTKPNNPDTDGDGVDDGEEVIVYGSDPNTQDTDGDGVGDGDEVNQGSSPTDPTDDQHAPPPADRVITIDFDPGPEPADLSAACAFEFEIEVGDGVIWHVLSGDSPIQETVLVPGDQQDCADGAGDNGTDSGCNLSDISITATPYSVGCVNQLPDLSNPWSPGVPPVGQWPFDPADADDEDVCDCLVVCTGCTCLDNVDSHHPNSCDGGITFEECKRDREDCERRRCPPAVCDDSGAGGGQPHTSIQTGASFSVSVTDDSSCTTSGSIEVGTDALLYNWAQRLAGGLAPHTVPVTIIGGFNPVELRPDDDSFLPLGPSDSDGYMLIKVNSDDSDFDGVAGLFDGFDLDGMDGPSDNPADGDDLLLEHNFTRLNLRLTADEDGDGLSDCSDEPSDEELNEYFVRFDYDGSAPWIGDKFVDLDADGSREHSMAGGILVSDGAFAVGDGPALRLWTRDADRPRIADDAAEDEGHYVLPGKVYRVSELGGAHDGGVGVYAESVSHSLTSLGDHSITVTVWEGTPDGQLGALVGNDELKVTGYDLQLVDAETLEPIGSPALSTAVPHFATASIDLSDPVVEVVPGTNDVQFVSEMTVEATLDDALLDLISGADAVIDEVHIFVNDEPLEDAMGSAITLPVATQKTADVSSRLAPFDFSGTIAPTSHPIIVEPGWNTVRLVAVNDMGRVGSVERSFLVETSRDVEFEPGELLGIRMEVTYLESSPNIDATVIPVHGFAFVTGELAPDPGGSGFVGTGADGSPFEILGLQHVNSPPYPALATFSHPNIYSGLTFGDIELSPVAPETPDELEGVVLVQASGTQVLGEIYSAAIAERGDIIRSDAGEAHVAFEEFLGPINLFSDSVSQGLQLLPVEDRESDPEIPYGLEADELDSEFFTYDVEFLPGLPAGRVFLASEQRHAVLPGAPSPIINVIRVTDFDDDSREFEDASYQPSIMLDQFAIGVAEGMLDAGTAWVGDLESLRQLGISGATALIERTYAWRIAVWVMYDRETVRALEEKISRENREAVERMEQLARVTTEIIGPLAAGGLNALAELLSADSEQFDQFGDDLQQALVVVSIIYDELLVELQSEIASMDSRDAGRLVGRVLGEVLIIVGESAVTGGGAAALRGTKIATLGGRLNSTMGRKTDDAARLLRQSASLVTDLLQRLSTTRMCFVAGTPVWTPTGLVAIEEVEAGDLVLSRNERTGEVAYKPVSETFVTHPAKLFTISIDRDGDGEADDEITGTGEHPFWVEERAAFVPMRKLAVGMALVSSVRSAPTAHIVDVQVERGPPVGGEPYTAYNFEVAEFNTYFVGQAGVWVHNRGAPCQRLAAMSIRLSKDTGTYGGKPYRRIRDVINKLNTARVAAGRPKLARKHMVDAILETADQTFRNPPRLPDGTIDFDVLSFRNTKTQLGGILADDTPEFDLEVHHTAVKDWVKWIAEQRNGGTLTPAQLDVLDLDGMPSLPLPRTWHNFGQSGIPTGRTFHDILGRVENRNPQDADAAIRMVLQAYEDM
ncbi:MAG: polymorphic toxin-type HINT domain-containing protein, partial [Planctomycetota bacterium]